MDILKICKKCKIEKSENEFYFATKNKLKRRATCISCHKNYRQSNKDYISNKRKQHYKNNIDYTSKVNKKWRDNNKEYLKEYYRSDKNKERQRQYKKNNRPHYREYQNNKLKTEPAYRLRKSLSSKITRALKKNNSKKYMSFLKFVPYTMEELKDYITKLFESWMTWDNNGSYHYDTWKDDDQSTWTWQIDHIIPQASLPYTSMSDDNFKKCWALENLRPLNSKQNLIDGVTQVRHVKN